MYTRFCERQTDRTKTRTTETKMVRDRHRETDSQLQKTETRTRWMDGGCVHSVYVVQMMMSEMQSGRR